MAYPDRICELESCGSKYTPRIRHQRFCSSACRNTWDIQTYKSSTPHLERGALGATSELLAAADLMLKGYDVFRALSPHSGCDLVAIGPDLRALRIEVRTGQNTRSGSLTWARNGSSRKRGPEHLDHYAVVSYGDDGTRVHYDPPLPVAGSESNGEPPEIHP